jgi:hypothetical protein
MKMLAGAALGTALLGSALLLPVSTEAQTAAAGIPGFLNPSTGTFAAQSTLLPATTALQRSGTMTVTVTATIGSNIAATTPLTCSVMIYSSDNEFYNTAGGEAVPLTRGPKGGTCKVAIPYIFEVASTKTLLTVRAQIDAGTITNPSLFYTATFTYSPFAVPKGNQSLTIPLAL